MAWRIVAITIELASCFAIGYFLIGPWIARRRAPKQPLMAPPPPPPPSMPSTGYYQMAIGRAAQQSAVNASLYRQGPITQLVWPSQVTSPYQQLPDEWKPSSYFSEVFNGYRVWSIGRRVTVPQGCLCSYSQQNSVWEAGKPKKAECGLGMHREPRSPVFACTCGLWSFKSATMLAQRMTGLASPLHAPANMDASLVFGQVKVWGRVIEHKHGYRSEYAYPTKLFIHKYSGTRPDDLAHYGVPVELDENPLLALVTHGARYGVK